MTAPASIACLAALALSLAACGAAADTGSRAKSDRVSAAEARLAATRARLEQMIVEARDRFNALSHEVWLAERAEVEAVDGAEPSAAPSRQSLARQTDTLLRKMWAERLAHEQVVADAKAELAAAREAAGLAPSQPQAPGASRVPDPVLPPSEVVKRIAPVTREEIEQMAREREAGRGPGR